MKIHTNSIKNGYLGDRFGHFGTQYLREKKPSYSFDLSWSDLPNATQTLALVFIDHDAIPVCGFSWIHWTVANIDPVLKKLPENASVDMDLLEGVTSWNSPLLPPEWYLDKEDAIGYGGCAPPDKTHQYTIEVYALDKKLNLQRGFFLNELLHAMEEHILDKATIQGLYKNKS